MPLPRWLKFGALALVAVLLFVFLIGPALRDEPGGVETSVLVGTPDGEVQIYDEGPLGFPQTIVKLSDVTISYIRWVTTFTASSEDYARYKVSALSRVNVDLQKFVSSTPPTFDECGSLVNVTINTGLEEFTVGTVYNVAKGFMDLSVDETAKVTADQIISRAKAGCGTDEGTFILKYRITLVIVAAGTGSVPSATIQGIYSTPLSLTTGTISGTETTTKSSG